MTARPSRGDVPASAVAGLGVSLRPVRDLDEPFCFELYVSTRADELAVLPWSEEQRRSFLAQQYRTRERAYAASFPDRVDWVVESQGIPLGRLAVASGSAAVVVIDIALLPEHRGQGLATVLLRGVLAGADRRELPVWLHVERSNPAVRLYRRLGFELAEESGPYQRMVRSARPHPPERRETAGTPELDRSGLRVGRESLTASRWAVFEPSVFEQSGKRTPLVDR
jgi:ribosomal protein S18 acetylase RimI-like enzyme